MPIVPTRSTLLRSQSRCRASICFYHEATYTDEAADRARERFHSTASEAAHIAKAAGVGRLMLGHYSKAYNTEAQHLAEARLIFPDTIAADEGLTIEL